MTRSYLLRAALAACLVFPTLATAGLQDVGPVDPVTGYPVWYRDGDGVALQLCLSDALNADGLPMCLDPASPDGIFPGSRGDENFWFLADAGIELPANPDHAFEGGRARLGLAVEAAYSVAMQRGDEVAFARFRVVMDAPVPGPYRIVFPFGERTLVAEQAGPRAIVHTEDIGIAPGFFEGALNGAIGPFLQWDSDHDRLVIVRAGRPTEYYIGDPNVEHTVTGSPYGTNYFRIEGPLGSNLDGQGNDFVQTPLFALLGQKYTVPIPRTLAVHRAVYATDGANLQLSVFAETEPASNLVLSGDGVPTLTLQSAPGGREYFGQATYTTATPPATVTLTNRSDDPPASMVVPVTDAVKVTAASYSFGVLHVEACTSDLTPGGPTLSVLGVELAPVGANGCTSGDLPMPVPPYRIAVESSKRGAALAFVDVIQFGNPEPPPPPPTIPGAQGPYAVTEDVAALLPVATIDDPLASIVILFPPAHGTVSVVAGGVAYTPAQDYFGLDSFAYAVQVGTEFSNVSTVSIDVAAVNDAPVAVNDTAVAVAGGQPITVNVLANDYDVDDSVLTIELVGTVEGATVVGNQIVYAPPTTAGVQTVQYRVLDAGGLSATGTLTVNVDAPANLIQITRAEYETAKSRWRVNGTTTFRGIVTVYNGTVVDPLRELGTAAIDATGAFQFDARGMPAPIGTPASVTVVAGDVAVTATVRVR